MVKVAAVQAGSVSYDLDASLAKLEKLVKEAKGEGAEFCVFPEAFLAGYPRHLPFEIGKRTEESREWFAKYVNSSLRIPDWAYGDVEKTVEEDDEEKFAAWEFLSRVAAENEMYLSVGIIERDQASPISSTIHCANVLIDSKGTLLSKHSKLQPTAAERIIWGQAHARDLRTGRDNMAVKATPFGRVGGLICWENYMPLARYALYQKGVEIWTAPTADGRLTWTPTMQHIAQEARAFVISANQFQSPSNFPEDYPPRAAPASAVVPTTVSNGEGEKESQIDETPKKEEVWCPGGSVIVGPLGQILAGPLWGKEGILYADINKDDIVGTKLDFDPVGHYARGDMFEFRVKGA